MKRLKIGRLILVNLLLLVLAVLILKFTPNNEKINLTICFNYLILMILLNSFIINE